jgi:hypothetical protein
LDRHLAITKLAENDGINRCGHRAFRLQRKILGCRYWAEKLPFVIILFHERNASIAEQLTATEQRE